MYKSHCEPPPLVIAEHYHFELCSQEVGEMISNSITGWLLSVNLRTQQISLKNQFGIVLWLHAESTWKWLLTEQKLTFFESHRNCASCGNRCSTTIRSFITHHPS